MWRETLSSLEEIYGMGILRSAQDDSPQLLGFEATGRLEKLEHGNSQKLRRRAGVSESGSPLPKS